MQASRVLVSLENCCLGFGCWQAVTTPTILGSFFSLRSHATGADSAHPWRPQPRVKRQLVEGWPPDRHGLGAQMTARHQILRPLTQIRCLQILSWEELKPCY